MAYMTSQLVDCNLLLDFLQHLPNLPRRPYSNRIPQTNLIATHLKQFLRHLPYFLKVDFTGIRTCNDARNVSPDAEIVIKCDTSDGGEAGEGVGHCGISVRFSESVC